MSSEIAIKCQKVIIYFDSFLLEAQGSKEIQNHHIIDPEPPDPRSDMQNLQIKNLQIKDPDSQD